MRVHVHVRAPVIFHVCVLCFLSYLKHIKWPSLIRLPDGEHVNQVGLGSVHLKHPALDLKDRK